MTATLPLHPSCAHTRYRLTCREFDALRHEASERCQICGTPERDLPGQLLHVDHEPAVGPWAVRGVLCNRCNTGMHLPAIAGPRVDAYLADPWYRRQPGRHVAPAKRPPGVDALLAHLDLVTRRAGSLGREVVRDELAAAIVAALKGGARPSEIVSRSPYSSSSVWRIARIGGVPPARQGRRGVTRG